MPTLSAMKVFTNAPWPVASLNLPVPPVILIRRGGSDRLARHKDAISPQRLVDVLQCLEPEVSEGSGQLSCDCITHRSCFVAAIPQQAKSSKTPRALYDWPEFLKEAMHLLRERGVPDIRLEPSWTKAEIERQMADWCKRRWGRVPVEATIRTYVSKAIKEITS
jgi:hypothetical protein